MSGRFSYLVLDLGFGGPPLALLALLGRRQLQARWRTLALATAFSVAYAAVADRAAAREALWRPSRRQTLGPRLGGIVIEEWISLIQMALGLSAVVVLTDERKSPTREK